MKLSIPLLFFLLVCFVSCDLKKKEFEPGFTNMSDLVAYRDQHRSILLPDGRILVSGGGWYGGNTPELFDPLENTFTALNGPSVFRGHTANYIEEDGQVILIGGLDSGAPSRQVVKYTYVEDGNGYFDALPDLLFPRSHHTATLLFGEQLIIVGGNENNLIERFDVPDNTAHEVEIETPFENFYIENHTATLLDNNSILIVGDISYQEPGDGTFQTKNVAILQYQSNKILIELLEQDLWTNYHTATKLDNGDVLVVGGAFDKSLKEVSTNAYLYTASSKTIQLLDAGIEDARAFHTANKMKDGKVLIVGGIDGLHTSKIRFAEVYDPDSRTFEKKERMNFPRFSHTTTFWRDDLLVVIGGMTLENSPIAEYYLYKD